MNPVVLDVEVVVAASILATKNWFPSISTFPLQVMPAATALRG